MRIGLTGGIASGKSQAAAMLRKLGAHVLDADQASRRAVEAGSRGLEEIASEFGSWTLLPDGTLNRRALGELVFSNDDARRRLNGILHGRIKQMLLEEASGIEAADGRAKIVFEVPLLIECGWQDMVDIVWVVTAPMEQRIARIMERDGLDRDGAMERINAQLSDDERIKYAHAVIENRGSIAELWDAVAALYAALEEDEKAQAD